MIYASKAFPCTAAFRLFAEEGLSCDVASAGELHLALAGGFDPARIYMHGNNKTEAELDYAIERGRRPHRGRLVRRDRAPARAARAAGAAARDARDQADHPLLHPDRPGRLEVRLRARRRAARGRALRRGRARAARAARPHRLADLRARGVREARRGARRRWATGRCSTSAAGSGSPTPPRTSRRRSRTTSDALLRRAPDGRDGALRAGPLARGQRRA